MTATCASCTAEVRPEPETLDMFLGRCAMCGREIEEDRK